MRSAPASRATQALPFLFFASGFASLTMEVIWAKEISQLAGSGVRASAAVASVLLGGLALGALLAGTFADRLLRPLRAYAWVEAGIALWAVVTIPLAPRLADLLSPIAPAPAAEPGWGMLATVVCLVLPGSLLMGATTPLVVRFDASSQPGPGRNETAGTSLGRLYASNTVGGALGAAIAAFLILPAMGLRGSLLLAAGISLVVAGAATWLTLQSAAAPRRMPHAEADRPRQAGREPWLPFLLLFLAGAASMGCQVAWTRVLVLLFGSSVQALGLTLAFGLAGLAAGSAIAAWALNRGVPPQRVAAWSLGLASALTLLTLPAWGNLPVAVVLSQARLGSSFATAVLLQSLFASFLVVPPAAALGALLPALTAVRGRHEQAGRLAAEGYGIDSAGSVVGGLATGFVLLPRLGAFDILRSLIMAETAILVMLVWRMPPRPAGRRSWALVAAALLAGAWLCPRWDPELMTSGPLLYGPAYLRVGGSRATGIAAAMRARGDLVLHEEGADATVTVRRSSAGTSSLQINGKTDASDGADLPSQILAGALPALLHPDPQRALVIGLATGSSDFAAAAAGAARVDGVELSAGVARAARHFAAVNGGILRNPRFRLTLADGRSFLRSSARRFDLIVSQPSNPWVAGVTNLFTTEFFRLARSRLDPGGAVGIWVQGYAMSARDFRSIVATFLQVFPEAMLFEESPGGGDYFLIGSIGRPASLRAMRDRLEQRPELRDLMVRAGCSTLPEVLARFVASGGALRRFAGSAPRITDDNLLLEYSAPKEIWRAGTGDLLAGLEAVRQDPSSAFAGLTLPENADLREALQGLQRSRRDRMRLALALQREDFAALSSPSLAVAAVLLRRGTPEPAIALLKRARAEAPESPVVPLMLGWALMQVGKSAEAEPWFRQAAAQNPVSSSAFEGMGLAVFRLGRVEEAERCFREAMRLDPEDADPAANLGAALLALGRDAEALDVLNRSVAMDPGHAAALVNRGVALARLGRVAEAIEDYRKALAIDPDNEDARYNLERASQRLKEKDGPPL